MNHIDQITLSFLKQYSEQDLARAIEENASLKQLIITYMPWILGLARISAPFYSSSDFNSETILNWLRPERPDLYRVLTRDSKARQWFENQMVELKGAFFGQ